VIAGIKNGIKGIGIASAEMGSDNAGWIQHEIDKCHANGGGRVVIPQGVFRCGRIRLRSHVELHLEAGAVLLCSENYKDILGPEGDQPDTPGAFIWAKDEEEVAITGQGVIDGNGRSYVAELLPHIYVMKKARPRMFALFRCRRLTISGITIRDSAEWSLWMCGCDSVLIHGIRLLNDLRTPNADGIGIDRCKNVTVRGCHIVAGDDAIVLKATRGADREGYGGIENVIVQGCNLKSTSSAIVIGCEIAAPVRNVVFDSCVISSSHRGLSINHSFESDIENVVFSNMLIETRIFDRLWWGNGEPIYVKALPWTEADVVGRIRNVTFRNIQARSENGIVIWGEKADRIQDVRLENVRLNLTKWSKYAGGEMDLRPCPGGENGFASAVFKHPIHALMLHQATDIRIDSFELVVDQESGFAYQGPFEVVGVQGLQIKNFCVNHTAERNNPD
jgi:polygalacturonase